VPEINYATTAEINGDWFPVDVTADYQPAEKSTMFEPGNPADLIITAIEYLDVNWEVLDETDWTPELIEKLVDDGFAFMKRRADNEKLEYALFRAA
jgi:hypothetical protein